jgi:hypothetical protein
LNDEHFFTPCQTAPNSGDQVYALEMHLSDAIEPFKSRDLRNAWLVALAADGIQILLLPFFVAGVLSPATVLVDFAAAMVLTRLLGWHWAFLPTVVAELVPGFDLFPTWTAALLYVTWRRSNQPPHEVESRELPSNRFLKS